MALRTLRPLCLLALGAYLISSVRAQVQSSPEPSELEQEEITVIGTFRPQLADAVKVQPMPGMEETDITLPLKLSYEVPLFLQPVPWQAPVVKPVALGKPTLQPLPNLFAKLGFGTQFSPLVEASYTSGRSEKVSYGIRGHYTSANGRRENQLYSLGGAQLFGRYFLGSSSLGGRAEVNSESVYFYGYDEEDTSYTRDEARRRFLRTDFEADLAAARRNDLGLDYGVRAGLATQSDQLGGSEMRPWLEASFRYALNDRDGIRLFTGYESMQYRGTYDRNRGVLRIRPGYTLQEEEYSILAGFEVAVDTGRFRLFPELEFQARLKDYGLRFFAGWTMRLQTNSWRSLTEQNPFLLDSISFNNTRVEDRYAGVRGEYRQRLGYEVRISQRPMEDYAFFINDSADTRKFRVQYEDVGLWTFHGELSYTQGERYRAFFSVDLRRFSDAGNQARAWHEPGILSNLGLRYQASNKLRLEADLLGYGPAWALLPDGSEERLRGTLDVNLGATYQVNRYFTAWADVNNLASFKHQRYFLYPSYGFRFMAGLQFSF